MDAESFIRPSRDEKALDNDSENDDDHDDKADQRQDADDQSTLDVLLGSTGAIGKTGELIIVESRNSLMNLLAIDIRFGQGLSRSGIGENALDVFGVFIPRFSHRLGVLMQFIKRNDVILGARDGREKTQRDGE